MFNLKVLIMDLKEFNERVIKCFTYFGYKFQSVVEVDCLKPFSKAYEICLDDSVSCLSLSFLLFMSESFNTAYVNVCYDNGLLVSVYYR